MDFDLADVYNSSQVTAVKDNESRIDSNQMGALLYFIKFKTNIYSTQHLLYPNMNHSLSNVRELVWSKSFTQFDALKLGTGYFPR